MEETVVSLRTTDTQRNMIEWEWEKEIMSITGITSSISCVENIGLGFYEWIVRWEWEWRRSSNHSQITNNAYPHFGSKQLVYMERKSFGGYAGNTNAKFANLSCLGERGQHIANVNVVGNITFYVANIGSLDRDKISYPLTNPFLMYTENLFELIPVSSQLHTTRT